MTGTYRTWGMYKKKAVPENCRLYTAVR